MKHHDIIVAIYSARTGSSYKDFKYTAFAGVSLLSTRPEGAYSMAARLGQNGYQVETEIGSSGAAYRKMVRISLPDDVHYGNYSIGGSSLLLPGLYADHAAHDGMGKTVYCYCGDIPEVTNGDYNTAIDTAINSGIFLSVPQANGKRASVKADVLAVSDLYGAVLPDSWQHQGQL